jgi:hypothetical protein
MIHFLKTKFADIFFIYLMKYVHKSKYLFSGTIHCIDNPIYVFPEKNCAASFPIPTFSICERFIYSLVTLTMNVEIGRQNIVILFWK